MIISRHTVDYEKLSHSFVIQSNNLLQHLDLLGKPSNLAILANTATNVLRLGSIVSPHSPLLARAVKIGAQAVRGLFAVASAKQDRIEILLDGKRIDLPARVDTSVIEPFRWIIGCWLGVLSKDEELLTDLCSIETSLLRQSSTRNPEYRFLLVDALKSFLSGQADAASHLIRALELTDPERLDVVQPDWAIQIDVPIIQLVFYLVSRDAEFPNAFQEAILLHKDYWTKTPERSVNWDGFISIHLSALAILATVRRMAFEVASDYLYVPPSLE